MSTLTTSTVNTIDAITNLTLQTGNSASSRIVLGSGQQGIAFAGNTSANVFIVNSVAISSSVNAIFTATVNAATINATTVNITGSSIATTGYSKLPNGLLMQWGTVSSNTSTGTITFSTAFAAAPFSVQLTSQSNVSVGEAVTSASTTTATVRTTSATSQTFYYLALGV